MVSGGRSGPTIPADPGPILHQGRLGGTQRPTAHGVSEGERSPLLPHTLHSQARPL